jgi:hypothetical protein
LAFPLQINLAKDETQRLCPNWQPPVEPMDLRE